MNRRKWGSGGCNYLCLVNAVKLRFFFYFVCFSVQTVSVSPRRFNRPLPIMCFNSGMFTTGAVVKMIPSLPLRDEIALRFFETIRTGCFPQLRMIFILKTIAMYSIMPVPALEHKICIS